MSDWILVPSLVALREEYNDVSPKRDKGADGSIGDKKHLSSSDHTPDEDSDVLRGRDADSKNEVHALDIDSSGPWPGGSAWFDASIKAIVERHKKGLDDRLQYVIWNRRIASRSVDNWRWREYVGTSDPHTNHAHFSNRYTDDAESDTSPWGVKEGNDMAFADDVVKITKSTAQRLGGNYKENDLVPAGILLQFAVIGAYDGKNAVNDLKSRFDVVTSPSTTNQEKAAALRVILGDASHDVGTLLAS